MSKRTSSEHSKENEETNWMKPFKKRQITVVDRKAQKDKALATISKFLHISDKYTTEWKIQQQKMRDKVQPFSDNTLFKGQLKDYQEVGVKWMETLYLSGINGILADEMGLGKTIQVIALLSLLQSRNIKGMHLIIVPLSTVPHWMSEFKRFAPSFPIITYHGNIEERKKTIELMQSYVDGEVEPKVYPIIILPQHYLTINEVAEFESFQFMYLIMDEGHRIKNPSSESSRSIRLLKCSNKLLLTGTPLQNDMTELWSLLNFIMPSIFSKIEAFEYLIQADDLANENVINSNFGENATIVETLQRVLEPFMLRRLKADVLPDNVPRKDILIYCDMTKVQVDMYTFALEKKLSKLKGNNIDDDYSFEELNRADRRFRKTGRKKPVKEDIFSNFNTVRNLSFANPVILYKRIVNHPFLIKSPMKAGGKEFLIDERIVQYSGKMKVLDAMLKKLIARGHKILIFSTLVILLEIIADYLSMRKWQFCMLIGKDNLEIREENVQKFNYDPEMKIFLMSTRAGGLGLNLTSADTVIFYDRDWNPQVDKQAAARCHRIGQTKPVMIYTLICKNSIDEYILNCSDLKIRLENLIMPKGKRGKTEDQIKTTEDLLNSLKKTDAVTWHPNGLTLTDKELDQLLDRSHFEKIVNNNIQVKKEEELEVEEGQEPEDEVFDIKLELEDEEFNIKQELEDEESNIKLELEVEEIKSEEE